MTLKAKKDGSFSVASKHDAAAARNRMDELGVVIDVYLTDPDLVELQTELANLQTALNAWVIAGHDYEDNAWKGTMVKGVVRSWDTAKLIRLIDKSLVFRVCNMTVDSQKLELAVQAGDIDAKKIAPALIEREKAAYVKWTQKAEDSSATKQAAAAKLADALGN